MLELIQYIRYKNDSCNLHRTTPFKHIEALLLFFDRNSGLREYIYIFFNFAEKNLSLNHNILMCL